MKKTNYVSITLVTLITLIAFLFNTSSFAINRNIDNEFTLLEDYIHEEIHSLQKSLTEENFFDNHNSQNPLNFTGFEMVLIGMVGFKIPFLAGAEASLELELVWVKEE